MRKGKGMAVIGFLFVVIMAAMVTLFFIASLKFGGPDLQSFGFLHWFFAIIAIAAVWVIVFNVSPFSIVLRG